MSYSHGEVSSKYREEPRTIEDKLLAAIDRQNKRVAHRESRTAEYRGRIRGVMFSEHIPVIRRRREMKLIMRDPYRDNTTNIGDATQFNTRMRGSSSITF